MDWIVNKSCSRYSNIRIERKILSNLKVEIPDGITFWLIKINKAQEDVLNYDFKFLIILIVLESELFMMRLWNW